MRGPQLSPICVRSSRSRPEFGRSNTSLLCFPRPDQTEQTDIAMSRPKRPSILKTASSQSIQSDVTPFKMVRFASTVEVFGRENNPSATGSRERPMRLVWNRTPTPPNTMFSPNIEEEGASETTMRPSLEQGRPPVKSPRPVRLAWNRTPTPPSTMFSADIEEEGASETTMRPSLEQGRPPVASQRLPSASSVRPAEETMMKDKEDTLRQPPVEWSYYDRTALVYKVVSRIFRTRFRLDNPEMVALSKNLLQQLEEQIVDWDVIVRPNKRSYDDVADAVYKDLCGFITSKCTPSVYDRNYSATVLEAIRLRLELPLKQRTLSSRLRSAWRGFCRRF